MADDSTETAADEAAEGGKKGLSKLKLILIAVAGVLLAAIIGGGVAMFLLGGSSDDQAESVSTDKPAQALYTKIRTLEGSPYFTVVVPSRDGRTHYMQLHVEAKSRDNEVVTALTKHMPKIVSVLNQLFSNQSFDELRSFQGKMMLQQAALAEIQRVMQQKIGKPGVEKVLFTGFVMQ
ncbi:flagellar basal body-associated FliL family protein [Amphritea sp. 1_MG-2023]|uniref:flagellar basal body-associated FliL family protein n=1 Tax=Amphritea sp. 1_MG-2023 TaxID=3062670 RepID=UPI0026E1B7E3|nr:flagellar basal body-associated FliL family protein [Amphritea sp. 1_MG-2023]MDO6564678.1 flagellar basal body-associated FliL family protein [Amphritea sp. 1_MG-2023]